MSFGKTFSVKESAAYLRVSTKTIRRYLKRGDLKAKTIDGKHGQEIRVFKSTLDTILGQMKQVSKGKEALVELNRLFGQATPEVREVVLKILRSSSEKEEQKGNGGLIASIFKRRSEDFQ